MLKTRIETINFRSYLKMYFHHQFLITIYLRSTAVKEDIDPPAEISKKIFRFIAISYGEKKLPHTENKKAQENYTK